MRRVPSVPPWNRRHVALWCAALLTPALMLAAAAVDPAAAQPAQDNRPNVLFIVTDDQRGGMEVLPKTRTYFAKQGRRYRNGFVTTPLCCPARASIMTGRYAHNHGIKTNRSFDGDIPYEDMLQAQLQNAGYRTGLYGKYLNALPLAATPPNFDDFAVTSPGYQDRKWNVNGVVQELPGYNAHLIGDFAANFISQRASDDRPWFLMLNPYGPHAPHTPETAYADADVPYARATPGARESDLSDKPRWVRQDDGRWDPEGRRIRRQQLRALMSIDDLVERVMTTLAATGQDNTIAVFMSDNGYLWGEHGYIGKGVAYTEAVRVPFYVRWPGRVLAGSNDHRLVANIDLAPTILGAVGLPVGEHDGRDLFDTSVRRDRMHLEYWCNTRTCHRWASTRTKTYQYIEHYDAEGNVVFREYYDLTDDPHQLRNYLRDGTGSNNPSVAPLAARLARDRFCTGASCP